jgi:hypothetical protein
MDYILISPTSPAGYLPAGRQAPDRFVFLRLSFIWGDSIQFFFYEKLTYHNMQSIIEGDNRCIVSGVLCLL